jgi:hypothetical protein
VRHDELRLAAEAAAAAAAAEAAAGDADGPTQLLTVRGVRVAAAATAPGGPPLGDGAPLVSDAAVVALVPHLQGGGGGGTVLRSAAADAAAADKLPLRLLQLVVPAALVGGNDGNGDVDGGVRVAVPVTAVTRVRDALLRALTAAGVQRCAEVSLVDGAGDDDSGGGSSGSGVAVLAAVGGAVVPCLLSVVAVNADSAATATTLPLASTVANHRHLLSQPGVALRVAVAAANVEALPPEAVAHLTGYAGEADATALSSSSTFDGGAGGGVNGGGGGSGGDTALLLAGNFSFLSLGSGTGGVGGGIGAGVGGAVSVLPQQVQVQHLLHPLAYMSQQLGTTVASVTSTPHFGGLHGGAAEYRPWDLTAAAAAQLLSPAAASTVSASAGGGSSGDAAWAPPGTPVGSDGGGGADEDAAGRGRVSPSTAQLQERVSGLVAALAACVAHLRRLLDAAKQEAGAGADCGAEGGSGGGTPASAAGGSAGTPIAAAVGIGAAASEIEARWLADCGATVYEGDGGVIMATAQEALTQLCAVRANSERCVKGAAAAARCAGVGKAGPGCAGLRTLPTRPSLLHAASPLQLTFAREKGGGNSGAFYAQENARAERARHVVFSCGAVPLLLSVVRLLPADGKPALQTLEQAIQVSERRGGRRGQGGWFCYRHHNHAYHQPALPPSHLHTIMCPSSA